MTHLDYHLDTKIWIGVPADVGGDGESAREWADWVVEQFAAESDPTPQQRERLSDALVELVGSRQPGDELIVFAPYVWGSLSAVSVRAGIVDEPLRPADIAGLEATDDLERYEEEIVTEHSADVRGLGTGMRFRRFVDDGEEGVRGVVVYAFVQEGLAVLVTASDYDLNRLGLMLPYVDELVRGIRIVED